MSEYTPCEETFIQVYINHRAPGDTTEGLVAEARRGLAKIKAESWDEGYEAAARYHDLDTEFAAPNPYREETHE